MFCYRKLEGKCERPLTSVWSSVAFLVEQSGQMLPVQDPQSQSECPRPRDSFGSANTEPARPHAVESNNLSSFRTLLWSKSDLDKPRDQMFS